VAGDILDPDTEIKDKARSAVAAGAFYGKWLPQLATGKGQDPRSFEEFGDLAKHIRFAERGSRKLARSTFYGMSRWQAALEKRQAWLGRIVDIGAELFSISSAVVYANTLAREQPERAAEVRELADLFCVQARRRAGNLFRDLWANDDDENHAAALKVRDGRYKLIEEGILDPSGDGPMISDPGENETVGADAS
ncbi:MAG: acyl-CoA dehydrogenase family protein, partial [Thermoleophilaceae bacterium]